MGDRSSNQSGNKSKTEEDKLNEQTNAEEPIGNDPFDLESLRLNQDFASRIGVKKALLSIPVRKPERQWFVRVRPEEGYRLPAAVLDLKEDRELYLVSPNCWEGLSGEIVPTELFTGISRQGVVFIWPVRLPGEDGRHNEWHRTAAEAAQRAMEEWVRVVANQNLGAYEVHFAGGELPEPEWPDLSFQELLRIAFKDHVIESLEHPALRRLRGEM